MKIFVIILFTLSLNQKLNAQTWITINDANYLSFLQQDFLNCLNGNQLNVDCIDVINATNLWMSDGDIAPISEIVGLEYFVNLQVLYCGWHNLTSLPTLPNSLKTLICYENQLTSLPTLPPNLEELQCNDNQLTNIPDIPNSLRILDCENNFLSELPNLPNEMTRLFCYNNDLNYLPNLPDSLVLFGCSGNKISCFPIFPSFISNFTDMTIVNNPFTCIPNYVSGMDAQMLAYPLCSENNITNNPNG